MYKKDLYWKEKNNDTVYWNEDFSKDDSIAFKSKKEFMEHRKNHNYPEDFSDILVVNIEQKNNKNVYWKKKNNDTIFFSENCNKLKKALPFKNIQTYMFHRKKFGYPQNFFHIKELNKNNKLTEIYYRLSDCRNKRRIKCSYAKFPRSIISRVNNINCEKEIDYIFIGAYKDNNIAKTFNRKWIIDFIKNNFTDNSYLEFTDDYTKKDHIKMGNYDKTLEKESTNKKNFDDSYITKLKKSKFSLCPAGDCVYSHRFYESLLCKTIPIVSDKVETYRTLAEKRLDYKFYLTSDKNIVYDQKMVDHNYQLFLKYHI